MFGVWGVQTPPVDSLRELTGTKIKGAHIMHERSLGSGPFYSSQYHLSRYPIDRDSPRDRDTPRLRYPSRHLEAFYSVAISSFAISH